MIDRDKIIPPRIKLTEAAGRQLSLMFSTDPVFKSKVLRIQITSKGCDGFKYALGITESLENDFEIDFYDFKLNLDPFCAYYLQDGVVDYQIDPTSNDDGFIIQNINQDKFRGKFWKHKKELTPPMKEES